jgi:hypothetical protein
MGEILNRRGVNVINVSIRHARPDPGAVLAWARTEVFAFVLYYQQATDEESRRAVGRWTRELIDAALSVGGTYYLPYQPHATESQFLRAYPRAPEFFALKKRLDPTNKFRNTLWDKYYAPTVDPALAELDAETRARLDTTANYRRDEGQTFLTHPEWYILYSSEEYAEWLKTKRPSAFPYLESIGQYWVNYAEIRRITRHRYPFNTPYQIMLGVIGVSYAGEFTAKAIYETLVGRFTEWTAAGQQTAEDRFAYEFATDYGKFIHREPWYRYHFARHLGTLWSLPWFDSNMIRKWERRGILTVELIIKAMYATLLQTIQSTGEQQAEQMQFVMTGWADSLAAGTPSIRKIARLDAVHTLAATPRYDGFRFGMLELARTGAKAVIKEVAGNDDILVSGVGPADWQWRSATSWVAYALPIPTDSTRKRVHLPLKVRDLLPALAALQNDPRFTLDHVYDY